MAICIDVEGCDRIGVTEASGNGLDGNAGTEEPGGRKVAQVVLPHARDIDLITRSSKCKRHAIRSPRRGAIRGVRKHECLGGQLYAELFRSRPMPFTLRCEPGQGCEVKGNSPTRMSLGSLLGQIVIGQVEPPGVRRPL